MAAERDIERRVCANAKRRGWLAFKWASPGQRGVPDRLFIRAGRVVAVEFKRPGKKATELQDHIIAQLRAEGIECHVIDNVEAGDHALA